MSEWRRRRLEEASSTAPRAIGPRGEGRFSLGRTGLGNSEHATLLVAVRRLAACCSSLSSPTSSRVASRGRQGGRSEMGARASRSKLDGCGEASKWRRSGRYPLSGQDSSLPRRIPRQVWATGGGSTDPWQRVSAGGKRGALHPRRNLHYRSPAPHLCSRTPPTHLRTASSARRASTTVVTGPKASNMNENKRPPLQPAKLPLRDQSPSANADALLSTPVSPREQPLLSSPSPSPPPSTSNPDAQPPPNSPPPPSPSPLPPLGARLVDGRETPIRGRGGKVGAEGARLAGLRKEGGQVRVGRWVRRWVREGWWAQG